MWNEDNTTASNRIPLCGEEFIWDESKESLLRNSRGYQEYVETRIATRESGWKGNEWERSNIIDGILAILYFWSNNRYINVDCTSPY